MSESLVVPAAMDDRFRVEMTVACKDCDGIPKVAEAGRICVRDGRAVQIMHNGLAVIAGGYHGDWMAEVIARLGGHHEPQEELVFHEILKRVGPRAKMIELGCFWAYYSLWFLKDHPERAALGVEPDENNLKVGRANALLNALRPEFLQGAVGQRDKDSASFLSETCGVVQIPMFRASTLCRDWGKGKIDILHCDAQGAELDILQDCEDLLRAGSIRFLVLSTHAEAISGDALTHQRCLHLIQRFGGQVLAEHDVHESFSGDGLIAAHFGSPLKDWPDLQLSHNRYSNSLFRNPLYDVVEQREDIAELANQTIGVGVSAAKVKQIYNSLLERDPEPGIGANQADPVDYCISVALSAEREALQRRKLSSGSPTGGQLVISDSPYGGNWVTDISDAVIGESLRTCGTFEEEEIAQVTKFLRRLERWQAGKTFVDVGSNIGTHTIFALHNGFSNALCFEPDQKNFRLLQVNQLLNGVSERCHNFNLAASNYEGTVELELSPDNFGDHRIRAAASSEDYELHAEKSRQTVEIKVIPVGSFIEGLGTALTGIGLVWIDTQGHDGHVLAGCASLLEAGVPVVAELWPYGLKRVNGYPLFRDAVRGRRIFDLRSIDASGFPAELQMVDLDNLHDSLIKRETEGFSPHTDLLVI